MPKNVQTKAQLHSSYMLAKYCPKSSKPGSNRMWTVNFKMFKLDLEKAQEPDIKLPMSAGSLKSKKVPEKHLLLLYWVRQSLCGKFFKRQKYQATWPASWEISMQAKKQQLELDMEKQTGSKYEKEYFKVVYCHPAYLTYIQSTSCEMPGWMTHKLESRFLGEISTTSDMQTCDSNGRK